MNAIAEVTMVLDQLLQMEELNMKVSAAQTYQERG